MKRHWTEDELRWYAIGLLPGEDQPMLEDHLLHCPRCLERVLAGISDEEITRAAQEVPLRFTEDTLVCIAKDRCRRPDLDKGKELLHASLFFYYTAAAVLAIAFVGGGIFQSFIETSINLSERASLSVQQSHAVEASGQWPDSLVDSAGQWIDGFGSQTERTAPSGTIKWSLPVLRFDWFKRV